MLALIRKHQYGIMLVVAIIVIIAFTFLYDPNRDQIGAQQGGITVMGDSYSQKEIQGILRSTGLAQTLGPPASQLPWELGYLDRRFGGPEPTDQIVNTLLVRKKSEELGIHVSDADVEEYVKTKLSNFQVNGQFDPGKWTDYLAGFGIGGEKGDRSQREIFTAVKDVIRFDKLKALLGANQPASALELDWGYNKDYTQTTAAEVFFPSSEITVEEPSDDQIKTYYDNNAESEEMLSEEKRGLVYTFIPGPTPEGLKDLEEAQKKEKQDAHTSKVADFSNRLVDSERDKTLEEIAGEIDASLEVKRAPAFARTSAPLDIAPKLQFIEAVFSRKADSEEEKIGDPVKMPDGYYLYEITEVLPPTKMEMEEARAKIVTKLKADQTAEKLKTAVDEFRQKALAAMEGGKGFVEAATESGRETKELPAFSRTKSLPPTDTPRGPQIAQLAASLNPGEVSEPLETPAGTLLVGVMKKELPNDPKMEDQKKTIADRIERSRGGANAFSNSAFIAWFSAEKDKAIEGLSGTRLEEKQ